MCYFNGQKVSKDEYIRLKHLEKLVARYQFLDRPVINGFDFGNIAVLKPAAGRTDFDLVPMEWGFLADAQQWPFLETRQQVTHIRSKHPDHKGVWMDGLDFLNAKGEELLLKNKVYRKAALKQHCIILSSGYYEWRHIFPINKRTGLPRKTPEKFPYRIMLANRNYFWMAGVWNQWTDYDTGEVLDTVTMVTTSGNEITSQIHNSKSRQPTILDDDLAWEWLFEPMSEARITEIATHKMPWQAFSWYTLAKDFLSSPDPLREQVYDNLPPLLVPGTPGDEPAGQLALF